MKVNLDMSLTERIAARGKTAIQYVDQNRTKGRHNTGTGGGRRADAQAARARPPTPQTEANQRGDHRLDNRRGPMPRQQARQTDHSTGDYHRADDRGGGRPRQRHPVQQQQQQQRQPLPERDLRNEISDRPDDDYFPHAETRWEAGDGYNRDENMRDDPDDLDDENYDDDVEMIEVTNNPRDRMRETPSHSPLARMTYQRNTVCAAFDEQGLQLHRSELYIAFLRDRLEHSHEAIIHYRNFGLNTDKYDMYRSFDKGRNPDYDEIPQDYRANSFLSATGVPMAEGETFWPIPKKKRTFTYEDPLAFKFPTYKVLTDYEKANKWKQLVRSRNSQASATAPPCKPSKVSTKRRRGTWNEEPADTGF